MCLLLSVLVSPARADDKKKPKAAKAKAPVHKTDWLYEARWGVMYHWASRLHPGAWGKKEQWETFIKNFDCKALAEQLDEVGAGYLLLTAQHWGHPVAPIKGDHIAAENRNFPSRDIIPELADELAKRDIHLALYFGTGMSSPEEQRVKTIASIRELSLRYGKKVRGWWLDNNNGKSEYEPIRKRYADAARAGNPDALVAFSPPKGHQRNSPLEDYTAGNTHAAGTITCEGRFIQGLQWHTLTYLGHMWGGATKHLGKSRYDAAKAMRITRQHVDGGGVITWDTPYEKDTGLIQARHIPLLKAINKAARECKRASAAARGVQPPPKPVGPHKTDWLCEARWGVSAAWAPGGDAATAVKAFDVAGLVKQLKEIRAGYLIINTHALAPGGKPPARDVIAELADALAKEKMYLILHVPVKGDEGIAALEALSKHYGKKVSAWWLEVDKRPDDAFGKRLAAAARASNPDALLAVAVRGRPHSPNCEQQDFTSGQEMSAGQLRCEYRFLQGLQWHTIAFLGFRRTDDYKAGAYPPHQVAEITANNVQNGGVISWRTHLGPKGLIGAGSLPHLTAAGKMARGLERVIRVRVEVKDPNVIKREPPPKNAVKTLCTHLAARSISAKMDWWAERQEMLLTGVGTTHQHFVRAYLLFDLSDVDEDKSVHSAYLYLHCSAEAVGDPMSARNQLEVNRYTQQIKDLETRWYLRRYAPEGGQLIYLIKPGLYKIDVTEIVKAWIEKGEPNYGFRLSAPGLGAAWRRFSMTWKGYDNGLYDKDKNPKGPRLEIFQLPKGKKP